MEAGFVFRVVSIMKFLSLTLALALVRVAIADGLPKDENDNLTVPHTLLTLSPSQVEEMEALNSVTLTKEQWAGLRKVSPGTPKRLEGILPITWNDCLCCAGPVAAVRMKDGKLAVWHESQDAKSLAYKFLQSGKLTLMVDRRGQFHLDGALVRYQVLLEAIRASTPVKLPKKGDYESGRAEVKVPPGMNLQDAVFEDRIRTVYAELATKGWNRGKLPWPFDRAGE